MRGGGRECHNFPLEIFCLTVPKNFVEEPSVLQKISGIEKCQGEERGGITTFHRKFVVSIPKNFVGETLRFRKFLVSPNFMDEKGS